MAQDFVGLLSEFESRLLMCQNPCASLSQYMVAKAFLAKHSSRGGNSERTCLFYFIFFSCSRAAGGCGLSCAVGLCGSKSPAHQADGSSGSSGPARADLAELWFAFVSLREELYLPCKEMNSWKNTDVGKKP